MTMCLLIVRVQGHHHGNMHQSTCFPPFFIPSIYSLLISFTGHLSFLLRGILTEAICYCCCLHVIMSCIYGNFIAAIANMGYL